MGGGEGVVDVEIAERRQRRDEIAFVLFLAGVEAGILEEQDVAVLHLRHRGRRVGADAIVGEGDRTAEDGADRRHDLFQRHLGIRLALRAAEMGEQDRLAALVGDFVDGRCDGTDARVVADLAVRHRHVEIDADEDALAGEIGVVERAEGGHGWLRV